MNSRISGQSYRITNRIALVIVICGFVIPASLPLLMDMPAWLLPACPCRLFLGRPCPMCGLTHGLSALIRGNPAQACAYNILATPVFLLLVCEFIYRIFASFIKFKPSHLIIFSRMDLRVHLILLLLYLVYSFVFFFRSC